MKNIILKHVLINAAQHDGKADVQAVLGKVIAEKPELRNKIKEIVLDIKKTLEEVNSWNLKKQEAQLKKLGVKLEEKVVKEGLLELPNAKKGKVVMRIAPYPSGPLHIGNARMAILNDEYAKRYKGKLILVFDDTIGSEEKFVIPEAYDLIKDSLGWLGVKIDKILYKSDRLDIFYRYTKEMIEKNFVYVCTCSVDVMRKNRKDGVECLCRRNSVEKNLLLWRKMLDSGFKEGGVVVRLKTDMRHPNPAFRDRVLMRIAEREHPRVGKKYHVWPMLEFSWAIDDHLLGITHVLRGKDLIIEDMMEDFIWEKMGWKKSEFVHYGLLNIQDVKLSKTEARKKIESGEYSGWDDPRTWSMQSLRKRGIQPEAVRKFVLSMGLSEADVSVPTEILYAENRKIIDSKSNRYSTVVNPVEISVKSAKTKSIKAPLHPAFLKRGSRTIPVNADKIYVEKDDFEKFKNKEVGLMNLFSARLKKVAEITDKRVKMELQKIHWVSEPSVGIKIVMPDGSVKTALSEPEIKNVKIGQTVQFPRIGFVALSERNVFYFAHK